MQLEFIELKLRNFLSFGNVEQIIKLNDKKHVLITGINKDKSADDESQKNGIGKSSFITALHYAIYGKSIGNKVTLPNLVNNINKKNMQVTLSFRKDDVFYRIERGRNPTYLHFYKEDEEITDESLGDSRDTQSVIEDIIGMSEELFCQTILLSCNVPIFMDQSTANQKLIIEKVLGVDIITKKIEALKEVIKATKNEIAQEDFRVQTVNTQTQALELTYKSQRDAMKLEYQVWEENHTKQLKEKQEMFDVLNAIDYSGQYNILKAWEHYNKDNILYLNSLDNIEELKASIATKQKRIDELKGKIESLEKVDVDSYMKLFAHNDEVNKEKEQYNKLMLEKNKVKARYTELVNGLNELNAKKKELEKSKEAYLKNVCPTCGQPLNKEAAEKEIATIDTTIKQFSDAEHMVNMEILEVNADLQTNYPEDNKVFDYKDTTPYRSLVELMGIKTQLDSYKNELNSITEQQALLSSQLTTNTVSKPVEPTEKSQFSSEQEMFSAKAQCEQLKKDIEQLSKETTNPYAKNINELEEKLKGITYANSDKLKGLQNDQSHNEILLKLLNSPSSYIRQAILDKSLEFLNSKIRYYLNKLGSLHIVKFNNDMSIDITSNGLTFGYVSSGELGRISIALTFAFRDAWENLSGIKSNLLMIDEVVDRNGLDTAGKNALIKCLLENEERNLFLVSHDADVSSHFKDKLYIVKEKGFSNIQL